jgi:hypothetical protein
MCLAPGKALFANGSLIMIYYESITSDMEEQVKYIKSFQEETA